MSFILTQEQVFNEARLGRNQQSAPLRACIVGGNAHTAYYHDQNKEDTLAGRYVCGTDVSYPYPGQPHGSIVDRSSVRVFANEVLLQLCSLDGVEPVGTRLDRVQSTKICFKAGRHGETEYPCHAAFLGRDCQVGDLIELASNTLNQKFRASIRGFAAVPQPALLSDVVYGKKNSAKAGVVAGGDFQGTEPATYIVQVVRGGCLPDRPEITVTTATGTDTDEKKYLEAMIDVPIGSKGVTLNFVDARSPLSKDTPALVEGDIFHVEARPAGHGPVQTLLFSRNAPFQLLQADDLKLSLLIQRSDVEIAEMDAEGMESNYFIDDSGVAVNGCLRLLEETTCDPHGGPASLPVNEADLYVSYRAWLPDMSNRAHVAVTPESVEDIPGEMIPDNELKWAVDLAIKNSGVCPVSYVAVADPDDPASWADAISKVAGDRDVYGIVPLTRNPDALAAVLAHVDQQSQPMDGRERKLWVSGVAEAMAPVADFSNSLDGDALMGCVEPDPDNQDNICLTVPDGNACFMAAGVRPGDIVRYHFSEDKHGNERYDEYVLSDVIHEESVRIAANQGLEVTGIAQRVEIWRTRTTNEIVGALIALAQGYDNRRVCVVWPEHILAQDTECEGWHLCAALAGLRSGILPQQDLSNVELVGLTDVDEVDDLLSGDQLDQLADAGIFVVNWNGGSITANAAVTTAQSDDPRNNEESVVGNLDSINKMLKRDMDIFFGKSGSSQPTASQLRIRLNQRLTSMATVRIHRLGGQVVEGEIETVRRHAFLPGRIVINANIVVPVPGRRGLPPSDTEVRRQVIA